MKNLLNAIQNLSDENLVNYLIENADYYVGTEDGTYFEIEGHEFEVNFSDDDVMDYLGLEKDLEAEEVIEAYENYEDEINRYFLLQSIDTVKADLQEQIDYEIEFAA